MRYSNDSLADAFMANARRNATRRGLLGGGVKLAGGGLLAVSLGAMPGIARAQDGATPAAGGDDAPFASDVEVLNYALTLEHLENAFYRDGLPQVGDLGTDGFGFSVSEQLAAIGAHEAAHVEALTATISQLGGTPVEEAAYNFEEAVASPEAFLATAMALENTGVSAYNGAGQYISDPVLLQTAGTIVAVEARHASYLNLINNEAPFPAPVDEDLTPDEVLEIAGPFIAS
jgi:rubrerythrin